MDDPHLLLFGTNYKLPTYFVKLLSAKPVSGWASLQSASFKVQGLKNTGNVT